MLHRWVYHGKRLPRADIVLQHSFEILGTCIRTLQGPYNLRVLASDVYHVNSKMYQGLGPAPAPHWRTGPDLELREQWELSCALCTSLSHEVRHSTLTSRRNPFNNRSTLLQYTSMVVVTWISRIRLFVTVVNICALMDEGRCARTKLNT